MAANPLAAGTALAKVKHLSHLELLDRCVDQPDQSRWTKPMWRAWRLEQEQDAAAQSLVKQVKRGNVKAMELYFRLVGTPETRPGAGVQVNVGHQTNISGVTVRVLGHDDPLIPRPAAAQLPSPTTAALPLAGPSTRELVDAMAQAVEGEVTETETETEAER